MEQISLTGGFADAPVHTARAFRAALDAMARPGRRHRLTGARPPGPLSPAAGALALTLFDPETPLWVSAALATGQIRDWLRFHTGAPLADRGAAAFAIGRWQDLLPLHDFAIGTAEYPDRACTLIVEVDDLGEAHRLTGPGIEHEAWLTVPDAAALRANAALFPLGVDLFLTCGEMVAALPRTTRIGDA